MKPLENRPPTPPPHRHRHCQRQQEQGKQSRQQGPLGLNKKKMSNFHCKEIILLAPLELILGTAPLRDD